MRSSVCGYYPKRSKCEYYNEPFIWQDIEESYLRLIKDFPYSGVYAYWFARIAKQAGKTEIAKKYYKLAIEQEPNNKLIQSKAKIYLQNNP